MDKVTVANFINLANNMVGSGLIPTGEANYELAKEYATQQSRIDAIGFAKWVTGTINPIYICNGNGTWEVIKPSPTPQPKEFISDEALYELYLLSINKK